MESSLRLAESRHIAAAFKVNLWNFHFEITFGENPEIVVHRNCSVFPRSTLRTYISNLHSNDLIQNT